MYDYGSGLFETTTHTPEKMRDEIRLEKVMRDVKPTDLWDIEIALSTVGKVVTYNGKEVIHGN